MEKSGIWKLRIPRGFSANLVLAAWFVFGGFLQHILLCNFLAILLKENNLICFNHFYVYYYNLSLHLSLLWTAPSTWSSEDCPPLLFQECL